MSKSHAINLLLEDIKRMHYKGGSRRFNVSKIIHRLENLCQNGT
jgi:hypothetical protein